MCEFKKGQFVQYFGNRNTLQKYRGRKMEVTDTCPCGCFRSGLYVAETRWPIVTLDSIYPIAGEGECDGRDWVVVDDWSKYFMVYE